MKRFHLTLIICTDFQSGLVNSFKTIKVQNFQMSDNFIEFIVKRFHVSVGTLYLAKTLHPNIYGKKLFHLTDEFILKIYESFPEQ